MPKLTIALASLALAGCVSGITGSDPELLAGHYSQGFEHDGFRPCGSDELWWVTEGTELRQRYQALSPAQYEEVYVELRGHAGPRGQFGHLGAYARELDAGEVVEIRPAQDSDCR